MPAVRNVKAGGTLAVDPSTGVVYGTRGNRSPDFFAYNPLNSRWQQLASVPGDKAPGRGAGAAADGKGSVYLAKGSSTPEFWRYDIAGNRWERLPDMPLDPSGKRNRAGASLAAAHQYGLEYVYALRGVTGELLRYSTAARTWQTFGAADPGTTQRWQKGSWLSVGPDSRLYVLKGKYNQLRTFGLEAEAWDAVLPPMPLYSSSSSRARRAGAGSSGTWQDGALYALKGGRSAEFWKYEPETRNWVEQEPMPVLGSSMKRAKPAAGAGLVSYPFGRLLYALKGGNTREFWRYFMPPAGQRGGTMSNPVVAVREAADAFVARLSVSPSPVRGTRAQLQYSVPVAGRATVSLLDVSGRVVRREQGQLSGRGRLQFSLDGLGAGSYLVQLDGPGYSTRERVVVVR
jgi:hypothetical protein